MATIAEMQVDPTKLRDLIVRAKALLGGHYETLDAKRRRARGIPIASSSSLREARR
jgi:hypothetical protein